METLAFVFSIIALLFSYIAVVNTKTLKREMDTNEKEVFSKIEVLDERFLRFINQVIGTLELLKPKKKVATKKVATKKKR